MLLFYFLRVAGRLGTLWSYRDFTKVWDRISHDVLGDQMRKWILTDSAVKWICNEGEIGERFFLKKK